MALLFNQVSHGLKTSFAALNNHILGPVAYSEVTCIDQKKNKATFHVNCRQTIHKKCQVLFSWKMQ